MQIATNAGTLTGPALAGTIAAVSFSAALGVTLAGSMVAAVSALLMVRREPYARESRAQRKGLWWRKNLSLGYWTSFMSGGWRGIFESFVPVVLSGGGMGTAVIGWLMSAAEGAQLLVGVWLSWSRSERLQTLVRLGAVLILLCVVVLPFVARSVVLAGIVLALAGWGAGMANTLAPAIANSNARPAEQGVALAVTGTYRAGARLVTPAAIGAASPLVGIPVALMLATAAMVAPVLSLGRRS